MIKKIFLIILILSLSFSGIFAAITSADPDEDSQQGGSSSEGINDASEDVKEIIELPPRDQRKITFVREVEIGGVTGTEFNYENLEDYITIMEFRNTRRDVSLAGESASQEIYYISSGSGNGEENERGDVPYYELMETCESNPLDCGSDMYSNFKETASESFNTNKQWEIYESIPELESEIEELRDTEGGLSGEQQTKLEGLEEQLENSREFLELTVSGSEFTKRILEGEDPEKIENILNDCSGVFGSLRCTFGNKITAEAKAKQAVLEISQGVKNGRTVTNGKCERESDDQCMTLEAYNDGLNDKIKSEFPELEETCEGSLVSCDVSNLKEKCSNYPQSEKETCLGDISVIETLQEELSDQQYIDPQGLGALAYGALSALINPDAKAMQAAKFFGFESRFQDLPEFLREDFPSQVCLYEIDGYLDETRSTTQNGVQGTTQYGCLNEKSLEYDEELGQNEVVGNHPCLQVLGDIRAQRTPLTPSDTVELTYSAYMRAPPGTTVYGEVLVRYTLEGRTITEKLREFEVDDLGTKTIFNGQSLPINSTRYDFSNFNDEQTIEVILKGKTDSGSNYVNIVSNAYKIGEGDTYSDPLRQSSSTSTDQEGSPFDSTFS